MERKTDKGMDYLREFPKMKKWINTCICCGKSGYDPSMPEVLTRNCGQGEFKTAFARYIREYFQEMNVNELGICEECQRVQGKLQSSLIRKKDDAD